MSTYAELQDRVAAFLYNRTDLTTIIPTLINQAQRKLEGEPWNCMVNHATAPLTESRISMPTNYISTIWMKVLDNGIYWDVEHTDLGTIGIEYPSPWTGLPQKFATDWARSEYVLAPAPDKTYTLDHYYYRHLDALSGDSDTNWWTTNAEELLVYGALIESESYIADDARLPIWKAFYDDSYGRLRRQEKNEQFSGTRQSVSGDYVI